jgi:hypothetical protein
MQGFLKQCHLTPLHNTALASQFKNFWQEGIESYQSSCLWHIHYHIVLHKIVTVMKFVTLAEFVITYPI